MIPWVLLNWRKVAIASSIVFTLGLALWTVSSIKEWGRNEVRLETITKDRKSIDAATSARTAHDLACARGLPECVSDGWTRDR
jgi:hypothetical protein